MIKKILIANRGEIACRIIKSARKMGIKTVAVYSDADKNAMHVDMADEAIHIGAAPAAQSYLIIDKIIDACQQSGADAVHPGYGFLSENAAFATALKKAGIIFIGPNQKAIEVMGDKIQSKKFADEANVSTVPGHIGVIESVDEAVEIAKNIGFPVMIKASAGGGGKGMRIAGNEAETREGYGLAKSEARSSFGDDRVFIEKFIVEPRHIEIQILGDKHGNVIHLNERECSIQRRNQKVVEEAPSAFLDEKTRAAMGAQAVALAKAVDYDSAGTVEFIVDKERNFYFLEMNTRLQVEHPVTELITGVDLVEQMINVASGKPLSLSQNDIGINGWAIESRLYAEDPFRNFLPSIGRLTRYLPPEESQGEEGIIRIDTGVEEGDEISIFYDPMIAKLCTHSHNRETATALMASALNRYYVDGIGHNIAFLSAIMNHPRWHSGDISTNFIADEYPDGFEGASLSDEQLSDIAICCIFMDHVENLRKRSISGQISSHAISYQHQRVAVINKQAFSFEIIEDDDIEGYVTHISLMKEGEKEATQRIEISSQWHPGNPIFSAYVNERKIDCQITPILNGVQILYHGAILKAHVYTQREAELAALMPEREVPDTSQMLLCPMPGLLVSLAVKEGDKVQAGQQLCVVEAMKMENILRAERATTITAIHAEEGDSLAVDQMIMEFGEEA